jgi:hypothetical protein
VSGKTANLFPNQALYQAVSVSGALLIPAPDLFLDRTLEFYRAANVEGGGSLASFKMMQRGCKTFVHGSGIWWGHRRERQTGAQEDRGEAAR